MLPETCPARLRMSGAFLSGNKKALSGGAGNLKGPRQRQSLRTRFHSTFLFDTWGVPASFPSDDQHWPLDLLTLFPTGLLRPDRHLLQLPVKGIQVGERLLLDLWDCVTHGWGFLGFVEACSPVPEHYRHHDWTALGLGILPGKVFLICLVARTGWKSGTMACSVVDRSQTRGTHGKGQENPHEQGRSCGGAETTRSGSSPRCWRKPADRLGWIMWKCPGTLTAITG